MMCWLNFWLMLKKSRMKKISGSSSMSQSVVGTMLGVVVCEAVASP